MTGDLFVRDVLVHGRQCDVVIRDGAVAAIGSNLMPVGELDVLDGGGGALLPGLHDHHLHLLAAATAQGSVAVGPNEAGTPAAFASLLQAADARLPSGRWLRAVGYHESVAGPLDRHQLDAIVPGRPIRVQHRSGALWVLSSAALDSLDTTDPPPGAERDATGSLTGRLHRADDWLRAQRGGSPAPDLAALGRSLARWGVSGVTDATPFSDLEGLTVLAASVSTGALPQRVTAMGGVELAGADFPPVLRSGPVKVILDEHNLPPLEELAGHVAEARRHGRRVAVHCVTRASLVLALVAWEAAGALPGDRIEHGSVIPPELVRVIAKLGLTVVTQPGFVAERGDQYRTDVDADDLGHLYPCRSLIEAGIAVAASSDAPYTDPDPWAAMRAAVTRTTRSGHVLGRTEAVPPGRALALYLGDAAHPGGPSRRVSVGAPADLCLLDGPVPTALEHLRSDRVAATIIAGSRVA